MTLGALVRVSMPAPLRPLVAAALVALLLAPTGAAATDPTQGHSPACNDDGWSACQAWPEACVHYNVTMPNGAQRSDKAHPSSSCQSHHVWLWWNGTTFSGE